MTPKIVSLPNFYLIKENFRKQRRVHREVFGGKWSEKQNGRAVKIFPPARSEVEQRAFVNKRKVTVHFVFFFVAENVPVFLVFELRNFLNFCKCQKEGEYPCRF